MTEKANYSLNIAEIAIIITAFKVACALYGYYRKFSVTGAILTEFLVPNDK